MNKKIPVHLAAFGWYAEHQAWLRDNEFMHHNPGTVQPCPAYLTGAYLTGANLTGAYLNGANLTGANLTGANLTGAYLAGAHLNGANLNGANLNGANLNGANLDGCVGQIVVVGPIGSRRAIAHCHRRGAGLYVTAGCWCGTIDEFEARVRSVHGDNQHARAYLAASSMFRAALAESECSPPKE